MADASVPDPVEAAWAAAVASWEDPARHEAVLAQVATYSCYAWAAGKYKARAGDPIADRQLERLRKAATATLLATATARPETTRMPYRNALLVLLLLVIMIGVGVVYAMVHRPSAPTDVQP